MSKGKEDRQKLTAEEREILRTRGKAIACREGNNMQLVRAEYQRRHENLNESLLGAFRRALWTTYRKHGNANN